MGRRARRRRRWHDGQRTATRAATVTDFGSIDLRRGAQPRSRATSPPPDAGGPTFAAGGPNPFKHEFTVRLDGHRPGRSRPRASTAACSPRSATRRLRAGFPKRMGAGGEAPIRYADLNGDNGQELIVPTEDGTRPRLPRRRLRAARLAGPHRSSELGARPRRRRPALAALRARRRASRRAARSSPTSTATARPELITTAGTHIYAWEPDGKPRARASRSRSNPASARPSHESQPLMHPKCGFLASPAVGHLEGTDEAARHRRALRSTATSTR